MRQRGLRQWDKNDQRALEIRNMSYKDNRSYVTYKAYMSDAATAANVAICLINQVNFLLDRQIKSLEEKFIREGGYTEKLRRQREEEKKRKLKNWFSHH